MKIVNIVKTEILEESNGETVPREELEKLFRLQGIK